MTTHDAINAVFEGGGALFLCLNIRRLLKDKSVKGVSLLTTSWWTAWGFWNVYFYAAVSCSASFWAGIAVVCANAVWLCLAVYYARHPVLTIGDIPVRTTTREGDCADDRQAYAQASREDRAAYLTGADGVRSPNCPACHLSPGLPACYRCWVKQGRP